MRQVHNEILHNLPVSYRFQCEVMIIILYSNSIYFVRNERRKKATFRGSMQQMEVVILRKASISCLGSYFIASLSI